MAALALLLHLSDGGGRLQVEKDDKWVTVQAHVVIMRTVYQVFTNGDHKACQHRKVQEEGREGLSMVLSLFPDPSLPTTPAPTFLEAPKQRLRYKSLMFPDAREANLLDLLHCIAVDAT